MARTKGLVIRVQNPLALKVPEVKSLFERAFNEKTLTHGVSDEVEYAIATVVGDPKWAVFLGQENNAFKSMMMVNANTSPLLPVPIVYAVYNEGTKALLKQMADEGIAFLKASGYDRFCLVNHIADETTFARLTAFLGKASRTTALLEYDIPNERDNRRKH
jgi:hypothetical protein